MRLILGILFGLGIGALLVTERGKRLLRSLTGTNWEDDYTAAKPWAPPPAQSWTPPASGTIEKQAVSAATRSEAAATPDVDASNAMATETAPAAGAAGGQGSQSKKRTTARQRSQEHQEPQKSAQGSEHLPTTPRIVGLKAQYPWLATFKDGELRNAAFAEAGTELDGWDKYVDVSHPSQGVIRPQTFGKKVPDGHVYVANSRVSEDTWYRLARLETSR